jgi:3-dehydroquinate dehydratase
VSVSAVLYPRWPPLKKIKILKKKNLLVVFFYMPHRERQHLDQLKLSLERSEANKQNIIAPAAYCHYSKIFLWWYVIRVA